jgi:CBS domain-containing protein
MLVSQILKEKGGAVYTIAPEAQLAQAAADLLSKRVGALVVCDSDRVVGIFSERDLVRAVAERGAPSLADRVDQWMTGDVVFAAPPETVAMLMERMTDRRIRHLPVLENSRLAGVISIGDVVKCQILEAQSEAESLKTYISRG